MQSSICLLSLIFDSVLGYSCYKRVAIELEVISIFMCAVYIILL